MTKPITHGHVFAIAWPIILANAAVPLLGIADTAVIGNFDTTTSLGGLGIGALIFNIIYWGFGFLRMGTTGLTAQALGAENTEEIVATFGRAIIIAAAISLSLIALQVPLATLIASVFQGSTEVEAAAKTYFLIRIWGAPAALFGFACLGWFIGLKRSGYVLALQLLLNGLNIGLDVLFVAGFEWGVAGVAWGTVIAEWVMAFAAALLILRKLKRRGWRIDWPRLRDPIPLLRMIAVNRDIFLRTLALLGGFVVFQWESARLGDVTLAANYILLQFIGFGAFFLDGFAFAVEALVGEAIGAKNRKRMSEAVRKSTEWALGTALLLACGTFLLGPFAIMALTTDPLVRNAATAFFGFAVIYPLIGVWPFQFDGIYIGATWTAAMRNAMALSFGIFLVAWWVLTPLWGNLGLWIAFLIFLSARGLTMGLAYPRLACNAIAD